MGKSPKKLITSDPAYPGKSAFSISLRYTPGKYTPELDGIRGIAILLVMIYHCFPSGITRGGWAGVDLFFVLSGFLITGILVDSKDKPHYYYHFLSRRILRIFPLYYFVLIIVFFVLPAISRSVLPPGFDYYTGHQLWFWLYIQNWLYSITGFPQSHLLVHFWSLGVEEQFYIVWPWIVYFCSKRGLIKVSVALCLVAILFRSLPAGWLPFEFPYRYLNTVSRMDDLLIGALIAQLIRSNPKWLERWTIPVGVVSFAIFLVAVILFRSMSFLHLTAVYTPIGLFMGALLLLSLSSKTRIRHIMKTRTLIFLGKYSYGLYVYHYILYILIEYNMQDWVNTHWRGFFMRMMVPGIITVMVAIPVSVLSYHLFEVHFLKWKKYFVTSNKKETGTESVIPSNS